MSDCDENHKLLYPCAIAQFSIGFCTVEGVTKVNNVQIVYHLILELASVQFTYI